MNFNMIIDMLFSETTINYDMINLEIPNQQIQDFFFSILLKFSSSNVLSIFNNKNPNNTNLIMVYQDNISLLSSNLKDIKPFEVLYKEILYITSQDMINLSYAIATNILESMLQKGEDGNDAYPNLFPSCAGILKQLLFFPYESAIEQAMNLIELITSKLFKCAENKNYCLTEQYTPEYLLNEVLYYDDMNKRDTDSSSLCVHRDCLVQQMMVLFFVFQFHVNLIMIKERYVSYLDNSVSYKQRISDMKEAFRSISYFQESYYCNFSMIQLYNEMFIVRKYNIPRLENVLIILMSSLAQFFPKYRIETINPLLPFNEMTNDGLIVKLRQCLKDNFNGWMDLFYQNPYLIAIETINMFSESQMQCEDDNDRINYYDLVQVYDSYCKNDPSKQHIRIFIISLIVIYIIFNNDMKKYDFLLDEDIQKTQINIIEFNTSIILLLWKIKAEMTIDQYNPIKSYFIVLLNDIILYKEACLLNIVNHDEIFDERLIQFIIENIESSHITSKYFEEFFTSKDPNKILNGFLLIGHWATKYPLKYIYLKLLDALFIFKKTIDLRTVLINERNINKFLKGIYLLFKAFPHLPEDFMQFIKYLKTSIPNWINDYSLLNYAVQSIDKLSRFANHELINSTYYNKNTLLIHFNSF